MLEMLVVPRKSAISAYSSSPPSNEQYYIYFRAREGVYSRWREEDEIGNIEKKDKRRSEQRFVGTIESEKANSEQ